MDYVEFWLAVVNYQLVPNLVNYPLVLNLSWISSRCFCKEIVSDTIKKACLCRKFDWPCLIWFWWITFMIDFEIGWLIWFEIVAIVKDSPVGLDGLIYFEHKCSEISIWSIHYHDMYGRIYYCTWHLPECLKIDTISLTILLTWYGGGPCKP